MESATPFLLLVPEVPFVLLYGPGIIVSLRRIRRHRRVSVLALIGFVGLSLSMLIRASLLVMGFSNMPREEFWIWQTTGNVIATFLTIAAWVCLMVAIFIDRGKDRSADVF